MFRDACVKGENKDPCRGLMLLGSFYLLDPSFYWQLMKHDLPVEFCLTVSQGRLIKHTHTQSRN